MSDRTVTHATYVIERSYPVAPAKVFAAFADPDRKRSWFMGSRSAGDFEMDFRVGGREVSSASISGGPFKGTPLTNETVYQDIVPGERIVFAYAMIIGDHRMSASLVTVQLRPGRGGKGTDLTFTDQGAYFERSDGVKMREVGWTQLLEQLAKDVAA
ncbi:MAG TPA: SRPBCC family protein [Gemmatimonadaceae bacterium]|nr:SRPBCC family protein [Gemmatimonadaceae bacterium]